MENTPTSGSDLVSLEMSVNTTGMEKGISATDKLTQSTDKVIDQIDKLADTSETASSSVGKMATVTVTAVNSVNDLAASTAVSNKNMVRASEVMSTANEATKNRIQLLQEQWLAEQALLKAEAAATATMGMSADAGANLIVKLREMIGAYGLTNEALLRHKADLAGVSASAEPLIAQLETLRQATIMYGESVTGLESIEKARIEFETSAQTAFNAFKIRTMAENRAAAIADINELEAARIAALEREEARQIVFNAFKIRTMAENRAEAMRILTEQEETAVRLAEKQAIEEIAWASKSVKSRIAELERLKEYQASAAIRPETIAATFSGAAINDLPNLSNYVNQLKETEAAAKKVKGAHDEMGISLGNNRARTEVLVLAHEALQGRYTRMPGSLMVLAEYTNAASLAFTGMGIATLGLIAGLGVLGYEIIKGVSSLTEFNHAMVLTGGYSGQTRESIAYMAEELKGNAHGAIGTTTELLNAMNNSGKFTSDTLREVGQTALMFQALTGKSTDEVAKYFEGMAVVHGRVFNEMSSKTAEWAYKANESYHFLDAAQYEYIRQLDLAGRTQEAQIEIAERMRESFSRHEEKIGLLTASYRGWVMMLQSASHWMQELGKDWFTPSSTSDDLDKATTQLEQYVKLKMQAKLGGTVNGQNLAPDLATYQTYSKLVEDQFKKVQELSKKYNAEQQDIEDTANKKKVDELGVWGQREIDSIRNSNRQKDDIAQNYIDRFLQGVTLSNRSKIEAWEKSYKGDVEHHDAEMALAIKSGALQIETTASVAKEIEDIKAKHHNRLAQDENDGYNIRLQEALKHNDAEFALAKDAVESNEKLLKKALQSHQISDEIGYELLRKNRADELAALDEWYKKRNDIIDAYTGKKKTDVARANKLRTEGDDKYSNTSGDISSAIGSNDEDRIKKDQIAYDKLVDSINKANEKELIGLDRAIEKQREHNAEIGKTKEQVELAREATEKAYAATNEREAEAIRAVLENSDIRKNMTDNETVMYQRRLAFLDRIISKQQELAGLHSDGADLQANSPDKLAKDAEKAAQQWKTAGDIIGKSLSDGLGKGAKAAGDMFKIFADGQARQITLSKDLMKSQAAAVGLKDEEKLKTVALNKYNAESAMARMNDYGNMASAAAGFFDTQSTGYKTLMAVSQVFHAAELAMSIAELVPKATAAVLTQGLGDPYTAFGRMAAMAAIVAGLGVAVGSIGSGGANGQSAAERQKVAGKGSVLGDSEAKSDSMAKSLEIMSKDSELGLVHSSKMVTYLQNIAGSMAGLTNLVARNTGITGSSVPGVNEGTSTSLTGVALGTGLIGLIASQIPVLSGIMNKLFGTTTKVIDQGILGMSATLKDINDVGFQAQSYATVNQTKKFLGFTYSDKTNEQTANLSQDIQDQFTKIIQSISGSIVTAADTLGLGGDDFIAKLNSFVIDLGHISVKGLTGEEIEKQFQTIFSKLGDDMAKFALDDLKDFQKVGEGFFETLTRVASDLMQVKDVYTVLGKTFTATGLDAINLSENMIAMNGGIENLTNKAKYFADNFLSAAEKLAPIQASVTAEMTRLGYAGVTTKEQFKSLTQSVDPSSPLFAGLMKVEEAFFYVADSAETAAKSARDAADKNFADAMDGVNAAYDRLSLTVSTEKSRLNETYEAEVAAIKAATAARKAAAQSNLKTAQDSLNAVNKVFDALTNALKTVRIESDAMDRARRQQAQLYIKNTLTMVRGGASVTDARGLNDSIAALSKPSQQMFKTFQDYARDQAEAINTLTDLQSVAKGEVDYNQLQVDRLTDLLKAVDDQGNAALAAAEERHKKEIAEQDKILNEAKLQIDVLNRIDSTLLSLRDALLQFAIAKAGAGAVQADIKAGNGMSGTPIGVNAGIESLYQSLLGRGSDVDGLKFWTSAASNGVSLTSMAQMFTDSPEYKSLHPFADGTNYVPYDMPAYVHEGEAIIPKADNRALLSAVTMNRGGNSDAEMKAMRIELAALRHENKAAMIAVERNTNEFARLARRWDGNGILIRTEANSPIATTTE